MKKLFKIFLISLVFFNFILINQISIASVGFSRTFVHYTNSNGSTSKSTWYTTSDKSLNAGANIFQVDVLSYDFNILANKSYDITIQGISKNIITKGLLNFNFYNEVENDSIYTYDNYVFNYTNNTFELKITNFRSQSNINKLILNINCTNNGIVSGLAYYTNNYEIIELNESYKLEKPTLSINDNELFILNPSNECNYEIYYYDHLLTTVTPNDINDNKITVLLSQYTVQQMVYQISVRAVNNETNGSGKEPSDFTYIDYNRTIEKLPKPTIDIKDNFLYISNVVDYATYNLSNNGKLLVDNNNQLISLNTKDNLENGKIVLYLPQVLKNNDDYSISVSANPNNSLDYSSNESDALYYGYNFDIDKPNISILGNTLMITSQINANFYDIYVNGTKKTTVSKQPFDLTLFNLNELKLPLGTYDITVIGYNTNESSIHSNSLQYTVDKIVEDDEEEIIDKSKYTPWKIKLTSWADDIFESDWMTNPDNAYGISLIDCPNAITKLELWFDIDNVNVGNTVTLEFSFSQSGLKWTDPIIQVYAIDIRGNYHEIDIKDCVFAQEGWNLLGDGIVKFVNTTEYEIESIYINWYAIQCKSLTFSMTSMNTSKSSITKSKEELENDRQNAILGFVSELPNLPNKIGAVIGEKFEQVGNTITNAVTNIGDKISDTVNDMKDAVTSAVEETGNLITNAINKIQQWLNDLLSGILDGLKTLFIPSDEFFSSFFDELYQFFTDKLGILILPFDIFISLLENFSNLDNGDGYIHVPQFDFMGQTLIPKTDYNLKEDVRTLLGEFYDFYYLAVDVIIYFMLFNMAKKKFENIVGGK